MSPFNNLFPVGVFSATQQAQCPGQIPLVSEECGHGCPCEDCSRLRVIGVGIDLDVSLIDYVTFDKALNSAGLVSSCTS